MQVVKMYCDRCGKEFKKWDRKHEEVIGISELIHDDGVTYLDEPKDLCESCYTELEKWWVYKAKEMVGPVQDCGK